ncbi:MAG: aminotransferase class I/II-fold pyridoxal phosphate-dependent enzyme, partial [Clostridia bacterium]|nr:aminotransferase class I/II-fold pyridoxal phosphate-dependent enzyme [Clostridia bacterium]
MKVNANFDNLVPNYLFADVARKTNEYIAANPDKPVIRMGIGDVTLPLCKAATDALKKGAEDLAHKESFKGYPDYEGYDFVREAISNYYKSFGVDVGADEILVTDGAKSDSANLQDIFAQDNVVLVTDPVYPVYVDSNIMAGREIIYAPSTEENGFCAMPDKSVHADLIYLCSPNNPTGAAYSKEQLKEWVDYANENDAIIIYDAAYEHFVVDDSARSIFQVEGARTCAIELCSMSKTAGFTGTRGGYTVIPK